jgi:hypothetical protein
MGQAVLLRNWTRRDLTDTRFSTAAGEQLGYLLNVAPRADSGAISQRDDQVQLWCVLYARQIHFPFADPVTPCMRIQGRLRIHGSPIYRLFRCPAEWRRGPGFVADRIRSDSPVSRGAVRRGCEPLATRYQWVLGRFRSLGYWYASCYFFL